jgi:hypothetical protein
VIYQLKCSHIGKDASGAWPDEKMLCGVCKYALPVIAVECREWHVKCANRCSFGRWYGQDHTSALTAVNRHIHPCTIDYAVPQRTSKTFRQVFGNRRVRKYILELDKFESFTVGEAVKPKDEVIPF